MKGPMRHFFMISNTNIFSISISISVDGERRSENGMKMASRSTLLVTWVASLKFYQTTASPLDSVKVVDAHTKIDLYEDFSAKHGWHHTRRTAKTRSLQYGEKSGRSHPFEKYSSENLVKSSHQKSTQQRRQQEISDGSNLGPAPTPATIYVNYKPYGASSPTPAVVEPDYSSYEPIRIKVDSRRLEPLVESDPDKYADLVDHLVTRAMPRATNFWSTHLSTVPVKGNITVYPEECSQPFNNDDAAYHTFDEADLVLYLILDEGPCLGKSPPIAFSNDCVMDQFDRPVAGWLLICANHFSSIAESSKKGKEKRNTLDEVLQHEFAHILGMSGANMPYYRDASNGGAPRTERPLVEEEVLCVNGNTESIVLPSNDTVRAGTTNKGVRYFEVVTPTVQNVVANQFDCESASGARLENQEFYDCIGSHWEARIFGTETMVTRNMPYEQSISAVTMALFEDTGWYRANFNASLGVMSSSSFGYGSGCEFLTEDCIVNDEVPNYGVDVFCNVLTTESAIKCDVAHKMAAKCDLVNYTSYDEDAVYPYFNSRSAPSAEYQHFSDEELGSFLGYDADYCPTYTAPPYFTYNNNGRVSGPQYMVCADINTSADDAYDFETFGSEYSKCFDTMGKLHRPLCLNVQCNVSGGELTMVVTIGNGEKIICDVDGQVIDLPNLDVSIVCPRREIVCPEAYCPANCSGRGRCRHGIVNGCDCFDPMDDSPFCANSPIVQPSQTPTASHAPSSVSETRTVSPSSSSSNAPSSFPSSFSPTDDFSQTKQPSKSPVVYSSTVNPTTISAANPVAAEDGDTSSEASRLILLNMSTLIMLSTVANYYFA